jgi:predicted Rdx family selenoprotein
MTGDPADAVDKAAEGAADAGDDARRATVRTSHDAPAVVAAALTPDNTGEMATRVADGQAVTTIERPTTGGLAATLDDYVVNVAVAERTAQHADRHTPTQP